MSSFDVIARRLLQSGAPSALAGDESGSRAAVAAVLRDHESLAEILFIERATRANDPWSGHMAFPGGRRQRGDASLLDTAKRETREEVGLDLEGARLIARLPDITPYTRMPEPLTVTAFVFALDHPAELTLNDEVAQAIWTPLDPVLANDNARRFRWQRDGVDLDLPALDVHGHVVWGLTYRMIELLREALA